MNAVLNYSLDVRLEFAGQEEKNYCRPVSPQQSNKVDEWIQAVLRFHKHVSLWQTFLQLETVDEDKLSSV
uniref:Uncharacterized protein n=1 Tax=Timema bartmani TaxID=61472 RepID=A0A7R9EP01_9NEOP|nr:unnamed protein product [Timema bartmani]